MATSFIASTATPPSPASMNGPNCGSSRTPRIISTPATISCTRNPSTRACGSCAASRAAMVSAAARTAAGIAQSECDAADLGLVARIGRDDFYRDRKADAGGLRRRFVRRLANALFGAASPCAASNASKAAPSRLSARPRGSSMAPTPRRNAAA